MVTLPAPTPVTTPAALTLATVLLLLIQVPPVTVSLKVMPEPTHTDDGPVTGPVGAEEVTLTTKVVKAVPQVFVTVYFTVSRPATRPPTTPVLNTEALPLLTLQVPPLTPSLRVMLELIQTKLAPVMVPALGELLTETE